MKRIVVIEDEAVLLKNIVDMLELSGFEVASAEDGETGLELIEQQPPDLVICDITMPGIDGYEVLMQIRKNPATLTTPFMFLTARADRPFMRHGMELGRRRLLDQAVYAVGTALGYRDAPGSPPGDCRRVHPRLASSQARPGPVGFSRTADPAGVHHGGNGHHFAANLPVEPRADARIIRHDGSRHAAPGPTGGTNRVDRPDSKPARSVPACFRNSGRRSSFLNC